MIRFRSSQNGVPGLVDYCASKFAAVGLDEALRLEFKKIGKTGLIDLKAVDFLPHNLIGLNLF